MRRAALVLAALALAGCGGGDGERRAETTPATETDVAATQVREVATRYLEAFGTLNLKAMCATLAPDTRERLARRAGSCPKAFRGVRPVQVRHVKYLLPNQVRVDGDRATVTVTPNGRGDDVTLTLAAVRVGGRWWIELQR